MLNIRRTLRREDGASLVEFALIAPILFLLLFGLIDFGFIYNDFLSLRHGVRAGYPRRPEHVPLGHELRLLCALRCVTGSGRVTTVVVRSAQPDEICLCRAST